jgi:hypothetical protein
VTRIHEQSQGHVVVDKRVAPEVGRSHNDKPYWKFYRMSSTATEAEDPATQLPSVDLKGLLESLNPAQRLGT